MAEETRNSGRGLGEELTRGESGGDSCIQRNDVIACPAIAHIEVAWAL